MPAAHNARPRATEAAQEQVEPAPHGAPVPRITPLNLHKHTDSEQIVASALFSERGEPRDGVRKKRRANSTTSSTHRAHKRVPHGDGEICGESGRLNVREELIPRRERPVLARAHWATV